jgi:iron complex transport system substrate-binding protein
MDTQFVWTGWSDGGAQSHSYTVTSAGGSIAANYKTQYQLTFTQSGLDSSANGTVVSTTGGLTSSGTYANMPFNNWVDSGAQVSYAFQDNVTTTVPGAIFTLSSSPSSGSVTVNAPATVSVTYGRAVFDYNGKLIHVPSASQINRIADSWPAHNTIIVMVGAQNKIVATSPSVTTILMFQRIFPPIKNMLAPFDSSGAPNIEQLLAANPDIVFVSSSSEPPAAAIENAGMLVVRLNFFNFTEMTKTAQLTGWILGEDALAKANAYASYFNGVIENVTSAISQVPASQKQTILHLVGNRVSPIQIDAGGGLVNTWINICGGINSAKDIAGNTQTVSIEQVLSMNPDIVLIGSAAANSVKDTIMNDTAWSPVNAVINGKVLANPMGVFDWSRYSVEEALNIQWVAKLLYPDKFANTNLRVETKNFYQTFYSYTLSEAEIDAILNNTSLPPLP